MADKKTDDLNSFFEQLKRNNREQEKTATKLNQALDELSDTAAKNLTENIKKSAKSLGVLNDEQLDLIKSSRDLAEAINEQEKKAEKWSKALEEYRKTIEQASKEEQSTAEKLIASAEKQLKSTQKKLDLEEVELNALVDGTRALRNQTDAHTAGAKKLNFFAQHVDTASNAAKGWAAKTFTAAASIALLTKGISKQIDEFNKLTSVGLQGTLFEVNLQAGLMKMSFEEMSEIISKNREAINMLGGGQGGIKQFSSTIRDLTEGSKDAVYSLSYMGKEGYKATARFASVITKSGIGISKDDKRFATTMHAMQKQFKEFSGVYGDSYDQYANLIETQMADENIQNRLVGLGKKQSDIILQETLARTANLKAIGMSNDQITVFNSKLQSLYDPNKRDQANVVKESASFRTTTSMLTNASAPGSALRDPAVQKILDELSMAEIRGDANTAQALRISKEGSNALKIREEEKNKQLQNGMSNFNSIQGLVNSIKSGGQQEDLASDQGKAASLASQKGLTPDAIDKLKASTKDTVDAQDLYSKSLKTARDVQQRLDSIVQNSVIISMVGLSAAVITSVGSLRSFILALNAANKALASSGIDAGGTPGRKGARNRRARKIGLLKGGVAAAAGLGLSYGADALKDNGHETAGGLADVGAKALEWGGTGAMLGTAIGPEGTAIGGALGGLVGAGVGLYDNWGNIFGSSDNKKPATPVNSVSGTIVRPNSSKSSLNKSTLISAMATNGMTDPKERAAFLAQMDHESGGFNYMNELSSGKQYEGRKDLGNTEQGDGIKYKGRGYIQLTGKANYKKYGDMIGQDLVNNPDLAADPNIASQIALAYWNDKKIGGKTLSEQAKAGNFDMVTKGINGGFNGKGDRDTKFANYLQTESSATSLAMNVPTSSTNPNFSPVSYNPDTSTSAGTTPTVATPVATTTDTPLGELKKHTTILTQIAANTSVSYKPQTNHDLFKKSPIKVANQI
jgi:predicted chitinase